MSKSFILTLAISFQVFLCSAQCAICTKTAASLDDKSARGLNGGILYLAAMPLIIMLFLGYKWYQQNKEQSV